MNDFKIHETDKLKAGFKVPDKYFDNLADRVMQAIPQQQEAKVIPIYKRRPVWISAAASFVLLLGGAFYFLSVHTVQPDAASIENYLVYNTNISAYDLGQHLDADDFKELENSMAISDDAIEDYLFNENISE